MSMLSRGALRRAMLLAWLLASSLVVSSGWAQEYFRVSPGPLSAGHAAYDRSERCGECHVAGQGVTNQKCLACHEAIKKTGGLHATFSGKGCINCHKEHKGRAFGIIAWSAVGGRAKFDHEVTGFSLKNYHGEIACSKCHTARLKTGRTSYLGLSSECQSCHRDAHGLTRPQLVNHCESCHEPGQSLRGQTLQAWQKPHSRLSSVVLEGKHTSLSCTQCHEGAKMPGRKPSRSCVDCHQPPHPVTQKTARCLDCHSQSKPLASASVDHEQYGFKLVGRHARAACSDCHAKKRAAGQGVRSCSACHVARHPVPRALAKCTQCHAPGGRWKGATIDHGRYGLALHGRHERIACTQCHRSRRALPKYEQGACTSCHTHASAHDGQYADKPCAGCHVEGGQRDKPFDHDVDSRFPLIGFHGKSNVRKDCLLCHPGKIYRTGTIACGDCHKDPHGGQLGAACEKCHSPLVRFDSPRAMDFDHSAFPLEGKHATVPCRDCHVDSQYVIANKACVDCHRKDDVHEMRLGEDCGRCHRPEKGAPKFSHNLMTRFPLAGAHRKAPCALCHNAGTSKQRPRPVGQWRSAGVPSLDRSFPKPKSRCSACHSDPHRGYVASDCSSCHTTVHFAVLAGPPARAILPGTHKGAWLSRHAALPSHDWELGAEGRNCSVCHGTPTCKSCHRSQRPRSHTGLWRLRTHGAAASFDPTPCRVCHTSASCTQCHRTTTPVNHRGAWATLHGYAAGGFGASNCSVCHSRLDCNQCHRSP